MTDTMETPHRLMTNQRRGCRKLGFTGCKVPGLEAYLLMHMGGGRKETAKTQKRARGGVRKKVKGLTPQKNKTNYTW